MIWHKRFASRFLALFQKRRLEQELDEELRLHLEMQIEDNIEDGMSPEEARYAARRTFGGIDQVKEEYRERRGLPFVESLVQDIRFALRSFRRSPTFTAAILITLTLGIGVGTAVFSIINAFLIKPMPYREPDRVVMLWDYSDDLGRSLEVVRSGGPTMGAADFLDRKRLSRSFSEMAAFRRYSNRLSRTEGEEQEMVGFAVTEGFFETLGVEPAMGRRFAPEEHSQKPGVGPAASAVVILQHNAWSARFGGDPDILGKQIELSGIPHAVVGVMPPGFALFNRSVEFFMPLDLSRFLKRPRDYTYFTVVARLRDGVTVEEAQAESDVITAQLASDYPSLHYEHRKLEVVRIAEDSAGHLREALSILFASVVVVMLIVCLNTAGLLLGRATSRTREIAVRRAIGAGQPRIIRQLLTESLLLSLVGAGAGFALAHLIVEHFQAIVPDPRGWGRALVQAEWIAADTWAAAFAVGVALAAGLFSGLAPALHAARVSPGTALAGATGVGPPRQARARNIVLCLEIALAVVLVCSAGLLCRSFIALYDQGPGFESQRRLSMAVVLRNSLPAELRRQIEETGPRGEVRRTWLAATSYARRRVLDRVRALPGVRDVALTNGIMTDSSSSLYLWVYRNGLPPHEPCEAVFRFVSTDYFSVMGIPLLKGRSFGDQDWLAEERAMIVSPQVVKECFAGQEPMHARVQFGGDTPTGPNREIVGVAGDLRERGIDKDPLPVVYEPFSGQVSFRLIVHADSDPLSLVPSIKEAIREVDKGGRATFFGVTRTLDGLVRDSAWKLNYSTLMIGSLAVLSLLLAAVGVYAALNEAVLQRTREVGLRMALGAERAEVLKMVLRRGLSIAAAGIALGLVAAAGLTRFLGSLLYGVEALDAPTFVGVAVVLLGAVLLASYIPARRAASVDPMAALRHE